MRRSSVPIAFGVYLVVVLIVLFGRAGWWWEWPRALSWASSVTLLLGPLAAGVVAFDIARRARPSLWSAAQVSRRGPMLLIGLTGAHWLAAVAAWCVAVALAMVVTATHNPGGAPGSWLLLQAPAALAASVTTGAVIGAAVGNLAAGPIAALVVYFAPIVLRPAGLWDLFSAGGATGSIFGIEPVPIVAVLHIVANALVALTGGALMIYLLGPRSRARLGIAIACMILTGIGLYAYGHTQPMIHGYRPVAGEDVCVSAGEVSVCGPERGRALMQIAATGIDEMAGQIAPYFEVDQWRYLYDHSGFTPPAPPEVGLVVLSTDTITGSEADPFDIAVAIATPIACPDYFAELPPIELLDSRSALAVWLTDIVEGVPATAADQALAAQTYEVLRACDAGALPVWGYEHGVD